MAKKKDEMVKAFLEKEWKVGDEATTKCGFLNDLARDPDRKEYIIIKKILPDWKFIESVFENP